MRCAPFALLVVAACSSAPVVTPEQPNNIWAFTAPWDARSSQSVKSHAAALDAVVTGWFALDTVTGRAVSLYSDSLGLTLPSRTRPMALVTSFYTDRFHPETVRGLAAEPAKLGAVAGELARTLGSRGYRGAVLDLEALSPTDLSALLSVTRAIRDSLHARGVTPVALAVPAGDTLGYPGAPLLASVDMLLVMLYDQHWANSAPGPIAAPDWARKLLALRVSEVGASRIVAAFPVYGYSWRAGASEVIGFDDARRLAGERGLLLTRDAASTTLRAAKDDWETWVSDAVLIEALITDAKPLGVRTFALWRLGLEDPAVWTRLAR
ncbi:MAG: hypothetical protein M3081_02225 [Gemmatimonadota bacterium]|nr:hypothetical protein [Gemmatimonadota bacterium]